jgi:hypothetical protein
MVASTMPPRPLGTSPPGVPTAESSFLGRDSQAETAWQDHPVSAASLLDEIPPLK